MKKPVISKPESLGKYKKILVHGPSGAGKTRFASTAPKPIIFDIEAGTMSIDKDKDVAVVQQSELSPNNLLEYLDWLATSEGSTYETVVIDSITHLQNEFLEVALAEVNDPRQAYGKWQAYLRKLMRKLFQLDKHTIVICRSKMGEDIEGAEKLFPEISPAAFSVVPALVDYALVITQKMSGLGRNTKRETLAFADHPKYWTKARSIVEPSEFPPTFDAFLEACK